MQCNIQTVAHHLQKEAVKRKIKPDKDAFARSSYNRYYYRSFLIVRNAFIIMNSSWRGTPHASYPELLRGPELKKKLEKERLIANKNKDQILFDVLNDAIIATNELSKILETANATRIAADYHVEIPVDFSRSNRFSLKGIDITEAHNWEKRVSFCTDRVLTAWRHIHA